MNSANSQQPQFAPPAYPPPRQPLLHPQSPTPFGIDLELLAHQGWVSLPIADSASDPLYGPFSALFEASAQFFSLPEEDKLKYRLANRAAYSASEEGYSNIPGEKCMITLRKAATTPSQFELRQRADAAWRASAELMREVLSRIEESLGMQPGVLTRTMGPKLELPGDGEENVATLLRMFRYERPKATTNSETSETVQPESKVVAEPHKDLGLLSLVVGHTPGLECFDPVAEKWVSCEELPGHEPGKLRASLLVGQTLAKFTNWRFQAGRHRVFVHPMSPLSHSSTSSPDAPDLVSSPASRLLADPSFRFSLVHALRAHLPLRVSSAEFKTSVTGPYAPNTQFPKVTIAEIYHAISNAHWNINISVDVRREQEQRLKLLKEQQEQATKVDVEANGSAVPTTAEALMKEIYMELQDFKDQDTKHRQYVNDKLAECERGIEDFVAKFERDVKDRVAKHMQNSDEMRKSREQLNERARQLDERERKLGERSRQLDKREKALKRWGRIISWFT